MKTLAFFLVLLLGTPSFAYDFKDAFRDIAPEDKGVAAAYKFVRYLHKLTSESQTDKQAEKFFGAIAEGIKEFDFRKIYRSDFLADWGDDYRGIRFAGISQPGVYDFRLVPKDTDPLAIQGFGSFYLDFALKKNDQSPFGGRSYVSYLESWAATEDLSHKNILALLESCLKVLDTANLGELEARFNNRGGANGQDKPFDVIDVFRRDFPEFSKYQDPYFDWTSKAEVLVCDLTPYTQFEMNWALKMDGISAHYPNVARYLTGLKDFAQVQTILRNQQGHRLLELVMDTQLRFFTLRCWTRDGKVVPVTDTGKPVFAEEFSLTGMSGMIWSSSTSMRNNIYGLKFGTEDIRVNGAYADEPDRARFAVKVEQVGETRIWGLAYYIIPKWVIDIFIPGDLNDLVEEFSTVLEQADSGKGSMLVLDWDRTNPSDQRMHYKATTEIADNFFLRFGFDVLRERFRMSNSTGAELQALINLSLSAFMDDLEAMERENDAPVPASTGEEPVKANPYAPPVPGASRG
ncbi:MAG: hypothetical protein KKA60_01965 [Proteobacteria bacterium]|nr:hypothetical protein [Pseudomonadota bacterium]